LVTLIGGGGVGKTRLALEVGVRAEAEFAGGAVWVELASLADGALVLPSVAAALGLRETEAGDTEPLEARLVARLSDGAPLLALDNCEHVLDAAAEVVQALLQHCPELHVLATSRQRLGLPGEVAWRVPSLPVPEPGEWSMVDGQWFMAEPAAIPHQRSTINPQPSALLEFAAVRLFVERAAAAREGFRLASRDEAEAVCLICRRLDGIPLAIELAAARVRVLTPSQIAARLDDRFHLLTTGARGGLPRHQTLRALIDWSYDQLPEAEAGLLRQLAVFAGGWTLEAAESVGAFSAGYREQPDPTAPSRHPTPDTLHPDTVLDLLDALVDRSLVLAEEVGEARRPSAASHSLGVPWAPGGEAGTAEGHRREAVVDEVVIAGGRAPGDGELRYRMLETVREYALEKLRERGEEEAARATHLACFLCLAEAVGPDLRGPDPGAALTQLEAERDNLRAALRFSAEHEAFRISASPLTADGEPLTAGEAGLRLGAALWPFWETRGYLSEGRHHLRAALKRSSLPDSAERAQALLGAARLAQHQFDLDEAETFGQESLERFRSLGDTRGMAAALLGLGEVAIERGDLTTAGSRLSEGLEASRQSGWTRGSAYMLVRLGGVAGILGENARARASVEEGRALAEALGDAPTLALAFHQLANQAEGEGDDARVGPLLEQSLEISRRLGHKRVAAVTLISLGHLAERQGDRSRAISFLERAMATYREIGSRMHLLWTLLDLGSVHYRGGVYASARAMYEESLGMSRELHHPYWIAAASNNLGMACFHLGDPVRAQALHREALALYQSCGSAEGIVWALERLGVVAAKHGDPQQAARLLGAASAARAEFGKESTAWEASDLKEAAAAVREKLGPEAWETAWQAGRAMAREEAIAFALDDTGT
jgi:predicted ATPase